jgi:phosphoribosyl 1,2-cyclic phosphate phosphodiesterase
MELLLLGTAAAEGCPGLFCECERCAQYRVHGGRSFRLRQAALINKNCLIDFGPDLLVAAQRQHIHLSKVTTALITHFHEDHWFSANLLYRHHWFREQQLPMLHLYGGPRLESEVLELCAQHRINTADMAIEYHIIHSRDYFSSGCYTVTAFSATHNPAVDPLIYAIQESDKRLIYACDTGPLSAETMTGLTGFSADLLVLEHTMGDKPAETHMGRTDFLSTVERLRANQALSSDAKIVATHFSHHYHPPHEKLEAQLAVYGIIAGYDGLRLTV